MPAARRSRRRARAWSPGTRPRVTGWSPSATPGAGQRALRDDQAARDAAAALRRLGRLGAAPRRGPAPAAGGSRPARGARASRRRRTGPSASPTRRSRTNSQSTARNPSLMIVSVSSDICGHRRSPAVPRGRSASCCRAGPARRRAGGSPTRVPSTTTPLVEPRSTSVTSPPERRSSAWLREMPGSSMRRSVSAPRPMRVTALGQRVRRAADLDPRDCPAPVAAAGTAGRRLGVGGGAGVGRAAHLEAAGGQLVVAARRRRSPAPRKA